MGHIQILFAPHPSNAERSPISWVNRVVSVFLSCWTPFCNKKNGWAPKRGAFQVVRRHCSKQYMQDSEHFNNKNHGFFLYQKKTPGWFLWHFTTPGFPVIQRGGENPSQPVQERRIVGSKWASRRLQLSPLKIGNCKAKQIIQVQLCQAMPVLTHRMWPRSLSWKCGSMPCGPVFFEHLGWTGTPCWFIQWLGLGESVISYASHYKNPQSRCFTPFCRQRTSEAMSTKQRCGESEPVATPWLLE